MNSPTRIASVLDASAVLAYLHRENGYLAVRSALRAGAAMSTVNLAEVHTKLVARGRSPELVGPRLRAFGLVSYHFTDDDALEAGRLLPLTRAHGLSLGDRACLALGRRLDLLVLTADRAWARVQAGVTIEVIR